MSFSTIRTHDNKSLDFLNDIVDVFIQNGLLDFCIVILYLLILLISGSHGNERKEGRKKGRKGERKEKHTKKQGCCTNGVVSISKGWSY